MTTTNTKASSSSSSSSITSSFMAAISKKWQHVYNILKKASRFNSQPTLETFPELVQLMIWFRALLAIFWGWRLGSAATRGAANIVMAVNAILFFPMLHCTTFLRADVESYGIQLLLGGVVPATTLFLLLWIYGFTAHHEQSSAQELQMLTQLVFSNATTMVKEQILAKIASSSSATTDSSSSNEGSVGSGETIATEPLSTASSTFSLNIPPVAESEF